MKQIERPVVVTLEGVWKKLGDEWVLRNVSLRVPRAALTVVLGPNGAGKTTLLRVIAGLYRPEKGRVAIQGLEPRRAARRGLLILSPDELGLYPRLTGSEHVELISGLYGCEWGLWREAARLLRLDAVLTRPVSEYSRGMRRKLQMLMALASCAPLLLLDEPLTGMDIASVYAATRLLRRVVEEEGRSLIVTTHEVWLAERMADYLVVLDSGRVLAAGEPGRLLREAGVKSLEEYLARVVYRVEGLG